MNCIVCGAYLPEGYGLICKICEKYPPIPVKTQKEKPSK